MSRARAPLHRSYPRARPSRSLGVLPLLLFTAAPFARTARNDEPYTVCLVGNALAERVQHHGWLEARVQARYPDARISVRNLGFGADEVAVAQRTQGFGSQDEHLTRCGADLVVGAWGFNESFKAPEGLAQYRADLEEWVRHVRAQDHDGDGKPTEVVLVTSIPFEDLGDPSLPDGRAHNTRIEATNAVTTEVGRALGVRVVDLNRPMADRYANEDAPLTINGIHLNDRGQRALGEIVLDALPDGAPAPELATFAALRELVLEKDLLWFNRYRATDGYNVYGGRSSLAYENGQTNYEVLQRELEVLDALCANLDRRMWTTVSGRAFEPVPVPAQIPVPTNRPGEGPGGTHLFRTGAEAIAAMTPAEGTVVECFADEGRFPRLVNPVQMAFDPAGRLWVACWRTYPHWKPGEPMDDRLVVLEDLDGDGRADRCETFADDLHNPTGFEHWNGGVLVACAPDLLFLRDTDGDGLADVRERLLHGLSSADTHHAANSFVIGPDGALYFQEGVFHQTQIESVYGPVRNRDACVWRFHPRTWRVERYVPYGFANPHGHVFDRWGQDFVTDGTGNDNYYALPFSGHLEPPDKHRGYFTFFRQRSRPAAATEILSSPAFPDDWQGDYLVANVIGFRGIFRYRLRDDGSGFGAEEREPLVFSEDPNFRPVDVEVGPDGAVYFLDWQNPLIGHMQHHLRDPSRDQAHGRVYRVRPAGRPLLAPEPVAGRPTDEVVALLAEPFDRVRARARAELSARPRREVLAAARAWMERLDTDTPDGTHALLEGLWLHAQNDAVARQALDDLLVSADPRARAAATRVVRNMRHRLDDAVDLLAARIEDDEPRVRLEALVALSFFPEERAAEAALRVLARPTDRFLDYALGETMRALEPAWRSALAAGRPFAADNPAGLAYALRSLDTESLRGVRPSRPKHEEVLARHGLEPADYLEAARGLAPSSDRSPAAELLAAVTRVDRDGPPHADHLIASLFHALALTGAPGSAEERALDGLARRGRRDATRRLALAAHLRASGDVEAAWNAASTDARALTRLLEALPYLDDPALARALYPRVLGLLRTTPEELAGRLGAAPRHTGRFVRIELPGQARTLTLAEVEVWSGGENVAPHGTATQSTTNWGGDASRAVDGIRDAVYARNGQTHTLEDQPDPSWELDLGAELPIDRIEIWNRGEGYSQRLEGYTLLVLDEHRASVLRLEQQPAPEPHAVHELTPPAVRVRQAAAAGLLQLGVVDGVQREQTVETLVGLLDDPQVGATVTGLLTALEPADWTPGAAEAVATRLAADFGTREASAFEGAGGRTLLALADRLLPALPRARALELYSARRRVGPQVIVIRAVPDRMLFDLAELTVVAGRPVELRFVNPDIMPHNWVLTAPGALALVGRAAEAMASDPDASSRAWVPALPEVLVATGLQQPGSSADLRFDAPAVPGDYPYVCTFPGHWVRMNGVMHVVEDLGDATSLPGEAARAAGAEEAAPARAFVREWTLDDLAGALARVDGASPARGRAVFEAASCLKCHSVDGEGASTGPALREVLGERERADLLRQILEPSLEIREGYASEIFETADGRLHAGRVVAESEAEILVQDDPYAEDLLVLTPDEVVERWPSNLSTMPEGLLSTFTRDEILDLLAYLESLASGSGGR